jgi:acetyltransferase-like isoleucine patch superfamily enzyme
MRFRSEGDGRFRPEDLGGCGPACVFEDGVRIFHPRNVRLGRNVYVGHDAILKGYHQNELVIGDETWIGQQCFIHSAGGIRIGSRVGIAPAVKILTSFHDESGRDVPILFSPIQTAPVVIEDDADVGIGAIVLPGVTIGRGAQIGAGAVVSTRPRRSRARCASSAPGSRATIPTPRSSSSTTGRATAPATAPARRWPASRRR